MLDVSINFLIGFELFVAVVLGFLIMIQRSKSGGGLGGLSGGGAAEEVLGAGSASMVVKATVVFSLIFLVNTLTIAALETKATAKQAEKEELLPGGAASSTAPAISTDTAVADPAAASAASTDTAATTPAPASALPVDDMSDAGAEPAGDPAPAIVDPEPAITP